MSEEVKFYSNIKSYQKKSRENFVINILFVFIVWENANEYNLITRYPVVVESNELVILHI